MKVLHQWYIAISGDLLHDVEVLVGTSVPEGAINADMYQTCAHYIDAMKQGATETIYCDSMVYGSVVIITIPGESERLTLCEVEVYAGMSTRLCK